ncbi:toll/interleukin-1 receptor domain-containing protein [Actinoplanes sp. NPDC051851]|uniref:toll/interleukin-1 receptor domain-containing protein n=1 Tax=Actinoplanes sp. NPDC051851 TaxID=3154753 RepID=UPI003437FC68
MTPPRRPTKQRPPIAEPVFFLSYARATTLPLRTGGGRIDPAGEQRAFYLDLVTRVNQLVPRSAGAEVGFMDQDIEAGTRWSEELLRNLRGCRVFVAMLSPHYLARSQWCPMEWDFFARREVRGAKGSTAQPNATAIVPILWAPVVTSMPASVREAQRFTPPLVSLPEHKRLYESEGVLGLQHLDQGAYTTFVWNLARQIQTMEADVDVLPSTRRTVRGLRRTFGDGAR